MTTNPTVPLRGVSIPVHLPESYACMLDVSEAMATASGSTGRAGAALLAFCIDWTGAKGEITAPLPFSYAGCGHSVAEFGGRVIDELVARDCNPVDIAKGARVCWALCNGVPVEHIHAEIKPAEIERHSRSLQQEVDALGDFGEPTAG